MKEIRIICTGIACAALLFFLPGGKVQARQLAPYGFAQTQQGVRWMEKDGNWLTDSWLEIAGLEYYLNEDGYIQVGFTQIDGKTYYLYPEGYKAVGWLFEEDGRYFFYNDGTMAVDTTVGSYQIGADGRAVCESELAKLVDSIIAEVTTEDMTGDQMLRACYKYVMKHTSYEREYGAPSGDWTGQYAMETLSSGKGNCYRYAAAFAYLAKGLGYETKVVTGSIKAARGGLTPHGWVEILIGDQWYVFDAEMQDAKDYDMYCKTYKTYPVKPLKKEKEWSVCF